MKYNHDEKRQAYQVRMTDKRISHFKSLSDTLTALGMEYDTNELYTATIKEINASIERKYKHLFYTETLNELISKVGIKTKYIELIRTAKSFNDLQAYEFNPLTYEYEVKEYCEIAETKEQQARLKDLQKLIKELNKYDTYKGQIVNGLKGVLLLGSDLQLKPNPAFIKRANQ